MANKLMEAKDKVRELSKKALDVTEDQSLTVQEQKSALDKIEPEIKTWTDEVQSLQEVAEKRKQFLGASGDPLEHGAPEGDSPAGKSLGEQFVNAQGFKSLRERGFSGKWTTGDVELKATLTEGTSAAPGGGYSPANINPTILPGVLDIRFLELKIADLFPQGTTNSPLIRYLVETSVTNGAAAVAEGGLKPESALAFSKVDEVLHKLATFLPVSDEMLEDYAQVQSYINARLMLFVRQQEEVQLLSGDGTGANLVGLLNRPGLATAIVKGTAPNTADNDMDAIYRQITKIRTTTFIEPDAVVIDPTAWQTITLSKNGQGAYYANGPFLGQQPASLWSKKVVVTPAIAAGTALVGAFAQGGQIFRKGGLTVEASNSHADFFQRNLYSHKGGGAIGACCVQAGRFRPGHRAVNRVTVGA